MSRIQKGKSPEINLEPEINQPQNGFKVTLQKPSRIKSNLDIHIIGQDGAKKALPEQGRSLQQKHKKYQYGRT